MARITHSDDYCTARIPMFGGTISVYYGYEVTDADDNWMFQVKRGADILYQEAPDQPGREPIEVWAECLTRFMEKHMTVSD